MLLRHDTARDESGRHRPPERLAPRLQLQRDLHRRELRRGRLNCDGSDRRLVPLGVVVLLQALELERHRRGDAEAAARVPERRVVLSARGRDVQPREARHVALHALVVQRRDGAHRYVRDGRLLCSLGTTLSLARSGVFARLTRGRLLLHCRRSLAGFSGFGFGFDVDHGRRGRRSRLTRLAKERCNCRHCASVYRAQERGLRAGGPTLPLRTSPPPQPPSRASPAAPYPCHTVPYPRHSGRLPPSHTPVTGVTGVSRPLGMPCCPRCSDSASTAVRPHDEFSLI